MNITPETADKIHQAVPERLGCVVEQGMEMQNAFWLDPASIQSTVELINETSVSTMAFAAATHPQLERVKSILYPSYAPNHHPLSDDFSSAIDFGYAYGNMAAKETRSKRTMPKLNEYVVEPNEEFWRSLISITERIDFGSKVDANRLFIFLREFEVQECRSDILAFCLAGAQDHILSEFYKYRKSQNYSQNRHSSSEIDDRRPYNPDALDDVRLQTLFYLGALVGAYCNSDNIFDQKNEIEVLRPINKGKESVSIRIEFDANEATPQTVEQLLKTKLIIKPAFQCDSDDSEKLFKGVYVEHNAFQFGPNMISQPIGADRGEIKLGIDAKDISAVVVEEPCFSAQSGSQLSLYGPNFFNYLQRDNQVIRSVLLKTGVCVSGIDRSHPASDQIIELLQDHFVGKDAIQYVSTFRTPSVEDHINKIAPKLPVSARLGLIVALGMEWSNETIAYTIGDPENAHPVNALVTNVITLALYGAYLKARKILASGEGKLATLDEMMQSGIDQKVLDAYHTKHEKS